MARDNRLLDHMRQSTTAILTEYDLTIYAQNLRKPKKVFVNAVGVKLCRYCGKSSPTVTFKKEAHILPAALGNRSFFAEDECDACNQFFGNTIDNQFGNWVLPQLVLSQVNGRGGLPAMKRKHLGWRVESKNNKLVFSQTEGAEIAEVKVLKRELYVKLIREPYIPIAVYKAFVKMAVGLMNPSDLPVFAPTIAWLLDPNHSVQVTGQCSKVMYSFIPGNAPENILYAALCKRKRTTAQDRPYMIFVVMFANYVYQIILPATPPLQTSPLSAVIFPFLFGPKGKQPIVIDLGNDVVVKNEPFDMTYGMDFAVPFWNVCYLLKRLWDKLIGA